MKTTKPAPKLVLDSVTLKPLQLDRVIGGGITDAITVTTATTSLTMYQTKWCKPGR